VATTQSWPQSTRSKYRSDPARCRGARQHQIPTIGAVLTATNLRAQRLFKVSPSNRDYAAAIKKYIESEPKLKSGTGVLFYDNRADDIYVRTLREAFEKQLPGYIGDRKWEYTGSRATNGEATTDFSDGRGRICSHNADMIFLAGRSRELPKLIANLAVRQSVCRHAKRIFIMSGTTGLAGLEDDKVLQELMRKKNITVIDASSADVPLWRTRNAPADFANFRTEFLKYFADTDLNDAYAIMHHDAVVTVAWAARRWAQDHNRLVPHANDVYVAIKNLNDCDPRGPNVVRAASGSLTFDDRSNGWPHGKTVPIIQIPPGTTPQGSTTYTTP
jgi:hypothetical protein